MHNLRTWERQVIFDNVPPYGGSKRWPGVVCEVSLSGDCLESGAGNHDLHQSHMPLFDRSSHLVLLLREVRCLQYSHGET